MISLLLTLVLSFASDLCNNKDIILILGYNYNLSHTLLITITHFGQDMLYLLLVHHHRRRHLRHHHPPGVGWTVQVAQLATQYTFSLN